MRLSGGRTLYGLALGILMLDTHSPRLVGDVGNAATWPFPVQYRVVRGADPARIMGRDPDPTLLAPFIDAARELEGLGVHAITTSCGFLAVFHRELQDAVAVPMLTSALLQVPFVSRVIGTRRRVGILTERPNLTERHFNAVGWSSQYVPIAVTAMPDGATFPKVYIDDEPTADADILEGDMLELATRAVREHPDTGALVFECTNFVPFSQAARRATGLPVYDLYTLVMHTFLATEGRTFERRL
ncbi:MAG: aspartate/glutamate racemase family protein [Chloroflexi bacterium]|nr:MAG: aspartate/glutamate racemase family protein [Chloroflexota bacterium]